MQLRDKQGRTEAEFLAAYRPGDYERPSVAADIVIFTVTDTREENYRKLPGKELRVLLIRRGGHPYLGCWALPGGFVRPGESAGQAAVRELREEAGIDGVYLEQLYTVSTPGRDPRMWVMSCAHMALVDAARLRVQAGDDAADAAWFTLSYRQLGEQREPFAEGVAKTSRCALELAGPARLSAVVEHRRIVTAHAHSEELAVLQNEGLAFDHAEILARAIERLRGGLHDTGLALHLMPERFTLTQLQQVYEVILGRPLLKAAFRRKVAPLVRPTDGQALPAGHRPSRLYERNWEALL